MLSKGKKKPKKHCFTTLNLFEYATTLSIFFQREVTDYIFSYPVLIKKKIIIISNGKINSN